MPGLGKIPITLQLAMNREQKLLHNQQVRSIGLLVATFLRNVVALPQALIELILKDLKRTLYVQPLRPLTLTLPRDLQATFSPYRSYNVYSPGMMFRLGPNMAIDNWTDDPPTRRGSPRGRLGYGSFQ